MTTSTQMAKSFSWNTLTVVIQVLVQLLYTALLARLIAPQSFALMGIVLSIMGFAEIFSQVGIGPALIQRKTITQAHINGAFWSALLLGVVFTLAFVATAPLWASMYQMPQLETIIQVVCTSFTIASLAVVPRSLMMKEMRFKSFFYASLISIIGGNLVVGLTLAYLEFDVWAYVWALFAQNILMTIALWFFEPTKIQFSWNWIAFKELFRYGSGSTLFNALNYAATKLDVSLLPLFIQRVTGLSSSEQLRQSGIYERSAYVISLPITIVAKLSDNVLFSGMAKMQEEKEKLKHTVLVGTRAMTLLILPASLFVIVFAPEIIRIYLGNQYAEAVPILQVLFFAVVFRTLSRIADALLRAKDAVFHGSLVKAIYLAIMGLGIFLTVPYGLVYVATAVSCTTCIHYAMSLFICRRILQISLREQLQALTAGVLLAIAITAVALIAAFLLRSFNLPAVVVLLAGLILVGLFTAGLVAIYPALLGRGRQNLLHLLPVSLKNKKITQRLLSKL